VKKKPSTASYGHPGQVALELEQVEVDAVHRLHADADELLGELRHVGILTDNPPVEVQAGQSALAAEDDEQRLPGLAGLLLALIIVVAPGDLALDRLGRDLLGRGALPAADGRHDPQSRADLPTTQETLLGLLIRSPAHQIKAGLVGTRFHRERELRPGTVPSVVSSINPGGNPEGNSPLRNSFSVLRPRFAYRARDVQACPLWLPPLCWFAWLGATISQAIAAKSQAATKKE
jgi:hypothetical protein